MRFPISVSCAEGVLVTNRVRFFLLVALMAPPAFAHGENVVVTCGVIVHGLPALALLLIPWHRLWARLLAAFVLAGSAVVLWSVVLPRIAHLSTSIFVEWAIVLSPTFISVFLAFLLRVFAESEGAQASGLRSAGVPPARRWP